MPIAKLVQITAWSYSRYTAYLQCPFAAKCKHVLGLPEPDNPAMLNGKQVHEQSATYLTSASKAPPLPAALWRFEKEYQALRALKPRPLVESEWAFNKVWEQCGWRDWAACWLRIKVDIHYTHRSNRLKIIDIKTGRINEDHTLQRSLYALGGLLVYPDVTSVEVEHWYLEQGEIRADKWPADALPELQAQWLDNAKPMLTDTLFAPRPGPYCQRCPYRHATGGPCVF